MKRKNEFTGERLIPGIKILKPSRIENLARLNFFLNQTEGKFILDLGCGAGEGTEYLAEQTGNKIIGIDSSSPALEVAKMQYRLTNVRFIQMDAEQLAFKNELFDAIVSIEVIEHINDPQKFLDEVYRILKSDGVFMLTTPNQLRSSPRAGTLWPEHLREYNPDQLKNLLEVFFPSVKLWGEYIPVYETNPIRKLVRTIAPYIKPYLPHWVRIRALLALQTAIKAELEKEDVVFSQNNLKEMPTLIAICNK